MYNPNMSQTRGNENPNMGDLPVSLMYTDTLPRGFASSYKIWRVNPQTSYNVYNPTDIIRFVFETQDYIDPYNSYLEIEVEFNPSDYLSNHSYNNSNDWPVGCPIFMLDGPATSLIDQLIIYSNSREVERVQLYDHIGYLQYDLNIGLKNRLFKPHEGYQFYRPMSNDNGAYNPPRINHNTNGSTQYNFLNGNFFTTSPESAEIFPTLTDPGRPFQYMNESYYVPG